MAYCLAKYPRLEGDILHMFIDDVSGHIGLVHNFVINCTGDHLHMALIFVCALWYESYDQPNKQICQARCWQFRPDWTHSVSSDTLHIKVPYGNVSHGHC